MSEQPSKKAIEIRDVSKVFEIADKPFKVLDHVAVDIRENELFTLLGPSGCGKTTLLRMIAGFEAPSSGDVRLYGEDIAALPPFKRPINTVFQNYALFPHMTVTENIAFGLEMLGKPKAEIVSRVAAMLKLVQLEHLKDRRTNQISGGQAQRVALARALAPQPKVLLLDEPLSALDYKLRKEMQSELKRLQGQTGITFIFVTHDQEEALTMSDRIAVMSEGRVQQVGTPEQIYNFPANHFVADFIGDTNFLEGKVVSMHEDRTVLKVGREDVTAAPANFPLMPGEKVTMVIRPEKLGIARELAPNLAPGAEVPAPAAPSNPAKPPQPRINAVMNARVLDSVFVGTDTRVEVTLKGGTELTVLVRNLDEDEEFKKGEKVVLTYDAIDSRLLPAAQLGTTEETYSGATPPPTSEPEKK